MMFEAGINHIKKGFKQATGLPSICIYDGLSNLSKHLGNSSVQEEYPKEIINNK